jgi:hypothetical protein
MTDLKSYLMDEVVIDMLEDFRKLREDRKNLNASESEDLYWQLHDRLEDEFRRVFDKHHALREGGSDALRQLDWLLEPQVKWCGSVGSVMEGEALWSLQQGAEDCERKEKLRQEILSEMDLLK